MSEREQHMDTDKRTGTSGQCGNTDEMRWDLGTLFPAKGDPRRPPEWLGRALLYIAIAIVLLSFCWRSWGKIEYLIIDVVISLFLALAVEPVVIPLVKHGWKRSFASIFALLMLGVLLCVMFGLFGNLFVQQVIALCNGLPALYQQICDFVAQYTDFKLPEINSLGENNANGIQYGTCNAIRQIEVKNALSTARMARENRNDEICVCRCPSHGPAPCRWSVPSQDG